MKRFMLNRWVLVLVLVSVTTFVKAERASVEGEAPPDISDILDEVREDANKAELIPSGNGLYVDLARELELSSRFKSDKETMDRMTQELSSRLVELKTLQASLGRAVEKEAQANTNLDLLITLYESIKAEEVAGLLKQMPLSVSVAMMKKMSPRKSSKILAAMDHRFAAEISRRLVQSSKK